MLLKFLFLRVFVFGSWWSWS